MKQFLSRKARFTLPLLVSVAFITQLCGQTYTQRGNRIKGKNLGDLNGYAVALNGEGNIMAVSAVFNDDFNWNAGMVRVYNWQDTAWKQLGQDILGNWPWNGQFGKAIALNDSGNVLVVGEINHGGSFTGSGAVKVFKWNGTTWNQLGNTIFGKEPYDSFGWSVSCSNDGLTIAAGSPNGKVGNTFQMAGHVRVFSWNGTAWIQKGADIGGINHGELFGSGVDLSGDGNTLVIGAPNKVVLLPHPGAAIIYNWNGTNWTQKGNALSSPYANSNFGQQVSISNDGNKIVVGAPKSTSAGKNGRGCFISYDYITLSNGANVWVQFGSSKFGKNASDKLGSSVVISKFGNFVIAGATQENLFNGDSTKAGYVLIYKRVNQNWQIIDSIKGVAGKEYFGSSVAINEFGNTVAVGAPESSTTIPPNYGYATVFASACSLNAAIYDSLGILVANRSNGKYQWYECDSILIPLIGEKNRIFIPKEAGEYTVVIRDSNCIDTAYCVTALPVFSTEEDLPIPSIEVFPNPTNSMCTLRFSQRLDEVTIKLRSIQGSLLIEKKYYNSQSIQIELPINSAVYILEISISGWQPFLYKIVKY